MTFPMIGKLCVVKSDVKTIIFVKKADRICSTL